MGLFLTIKTYNGPSCPVCGDLIETRQTKDCPDEVIQKAWSDEKELGSISNPMPLDYYMENICDTEQDCIDFIGSCEGDEYDKHKWDAVEAKPIYRGTIFKWGLKRKKEGE